MSAKLLSVADAVLALINGQPAGTFPLAFLATRVPVRIVALEELSTVDVAVVTGDGSCSTSSEADGMFQRDLEFNIEIRQRVDDVTDNAQVDPLITLCEQLGDLMLTQSGGLADGNAFCKTASYAYATSELEQSGLFVGVLSLTYGVIQ
jgi:hypothetical protein